MTRRPITVRSIWIYYYRYRETLLFSAVLFLGVIIISSLLLWKIILPQVEKWFSIREEVIATEERIKTIRENILIASRVDENELTNNLNTAIAAYPSEKDFIGILAAVSESAGRTNVALDDFSFSVGELSTNSAEFKVEPLLLDLIIMAESENVTNFVQEIQKKLPLSIIESYESLGETKKITLAFPFQPLSKISYKDAEPLQQITARDQELLNTLSSWLPDSVLSQ